MAWSIGINFRSTAGFVTDPVGTTYCLAETYPVTRGGVTFGWEDAITGNGRDRSTGIDARLAGVNFATSGGGTKRFRVDLPATGTYLVRLALGDTATSVATAGVDLIDGTTTFATVSGAFGASQWFDATGVLRTSSAAWASGNATLSRTFAGTVFRARLADSTAGSNASRIAHLFVQQVDAARSYKAGKARKAS